MDKYIKLQEETYEANMRLPGLGLVLFTFGNVSIADHQLGVFCIKPSGIPYKKLSPKKMVTLDFDGKTVNGKLRPSSDTKTHGLLYQHWKKIGAIVHTHSTYATAWAQAQQDIPLLGTTHADHCTTDIPCAPPMHDSKIEGDYEHETGWQIIHCFEERKLNYEETEMVLVANHAPFVWAANSEKAVYNAAVLEEIARLAWLTRQINPAAARMKDALIKKHHQRKHGPDSYYGQS